MTQLTSNKFEADNEVLLVNNDKDQLRTDATEETLLSIDEIEEIVAQIDKDYVDHIRVDAAEEVPITMHKNMEVVAVQEMNEEGQFKLDDTDLGSITVDSDKEEITQENDMTHLTSEKFVEDSEVLLVDNDENQLRIDTAEEILVSIDEDK